jgi:hypothetical protein
VTSSLLAGDGLAESTGVTAGDGELSSWWGGRLLLVLVVAALAVPVVVAIVALHDPRWHANLDLALTELRVRDVTAGRPPQVGLPGRINAFGFQGSHPGPMSFWLLAPLYQLFGRSSWALAASTAMLNLGAAASAVWLGSRRGGRLGALGAATVMAALFQAFGPERWSQPWNPYLPVMWWPVFLLAVWSVLCDDRPIIPVAIVAGTFCAQTHVSYVGLVAVLGAVIAAYLGGTVIHRGAARSRAAETFRWAGIGTALLVVLWAPPLIEQVQSSPGNLSILREQFTNPVEPSVGLSRGVGIWLRALNPLGLVTGRVHLTGPVWPGAALIIAWGVAATLAWRRGPRALERLHIVVGLSLAAGLVSVSRIQGRVFDYLMMWSWGTTALALASVVVVAAVWAGEQRVKAGHEGLRWTPVAAAALSGVVGLALCITISQAANAKPPQPGQASIHSRVLPDAVDALRSGRAPGGGVDGRYVVRSDDPVSGGLNTYTVLLELERQGFDVGIDEFYSVPARPFRVLTPSNATGVVTYVVGAAIEDWRGRDDAVEIAHAEPTAADAARYAELRDQVVDDLRAAGYGSEAEIFDDNLLAFALDEHVPEPTIDRLRTMIELSGPTSIFVSPSVPGG